MEASAGASECTWRTSGCVLGMEARGAAPSTCNQCQSRITSNETQPGIWMRALNGNGHGPCCCLRVRPWHCYIPDAGDNGQCCDGCMVEQLRQMLQGRLRDPKRPAASLCILLPVTCILPHTCPSPHCTRQHSCQHTETPMQQGAATHVQPGTAKTAL